MSINIGDRVALSAKFLRSIGDYSHASASKRGTVVSCEGTDSWRLLGIEWDGDVDGPRHVLDKNLVRAARIHLEPA